MKLIYILIFRTVKCMSVYRVQVYNYVELENDYVLYLTSAHIPTVYTDPKESLKIENILLINASVTLPILQLFH